MRLTKRIKEKCEFELSKFTMNHGTSGMRMAIATSLMLSSAFANTFVLADAGITTKIVKVITEMVSIATTVVMGAGVLFLIIAIFNWVSAIKQDEPERASKGPQNVIIAALMCLVKPITVIILNALGLDQDFGLGGGAGGLD